jgi:hypothetical protein
MKPSNLLFLVAIPLLAQSGSVIDSDSRNFEGKNGFYWQTRLEPGSPPLASGFGRITRGPSPQGPAQVDRILLDRIHKVYFGYHVAIVVEKGDFILTFSPVAPIADLAKEAHIEDPQSWKAIGPELKSTQMARLNDVIALPLMTNSDTGQKIVEYISIQQANPPSSGVASFGPPPYHREFSYTAGVARDFTINDAQLHFVAPRVQINGVVDESFDARLRDLASPLIWLYIPNKGRFTFSLAPRPESGFSAAGEIRGTSLTFKDGSDSYTITSAVPIAPADVPIKLYVLHEPNGKPLEPFSDPSSISMDARDLLRPKKTPIP